MASVWGVLLLCAAPAVTLAVTAARGGMSNPWILPLAAIAFMANAAVIFSDVRYGLALFIITAGVSPKLPGIYNNLRVEDFIFVVVFLTWAGRRMQAGGLPPLSSPIVAPFVVLTLMSVMSTFWGISIGVIPDVKYSIFLQLKRVEYFLIFYIVTSTVRSEGWLRILTILFVVSGAIAALYGLANPSSAYGQTVAEKRVSGPEGENYNTLSGYLVICIATGIAAIPSFRKGTTKTFLILCTALAAAGVLMSFSREGYVMLFGSLLSFGFTRHRKVVFGALLVLAMVFFLAEPVRQNVHNTVGQIQNSQNDDPGSNSLTARYRSWEYRWNGWFIKQPLFGNGVGAVALSVDNEYLLRACEVGIVGFAIFLWWLSSIWKQVQRLQRSVGFPQMISTGLGAAFVGLLIQGSVAASFNSIRTMEPFWFLLGLVTAAVAIHREQLTQEAKICAS